MIQKRAAGKKRNHWPYDWPGCHACRKKFQKDEEYVGVGGDTSSYIHRTCLDNWLRDHPPLEGGGAQKVLSHEQIESEFAKLQRRLKRQAAAARKTKTSGKS